MGKGGGGSTNTVQTQSAPDPRIMQAYLNVVNQAQGVAGQPLQQYAGPLVAGFTPQQQAAFNTINNVQGTPQPYINAAANLAGAAAQPITPMQFSGNAVQNYMSPFTQDVVGTTMANINETNAQQQQQVVGDAVSRGAWGGDRSAIAQSELARQQALAGNQQIAQLENQGYAQALGEFNAQQQAGIGAQEASQWLAANASGQMGNLGAEAQGTALTGASSELQAGALQQQLAQEQLNVPFEQFTQAQAYPFQTTNFLAGITEGIGGMTGGQASTTSPGPSTLGQIAGLGMAGLGAAGQAGLFNSSGGGGGVFGSDASTFTGDTGVNFASRGGRMLRAGFADGGDTSDPWSSDMANDVPNVDVSVVGDPLAVGMERGPPSAPALPSSSSSSSGSGSNADTLKTVMQVAEIAAMFLNKGGRVGRDSGGGVPNVDTSITGGMPGMGAPSGGSGTGTAFGSPASMLSGAGGATQTQSSGGGQDNTLQTVLQIAAIAAMLLNRGGRVGRDHLADGGSAQPYPPAAASTSSAVAPPQGHPATASSAAAPQSSGGLPGMFAGSGSPGKMAGNSAMLPQFVSSNFGGPGGVNQPYTGPPIQSTPGMPGWQSGQGINWVSGQGTPSPLGLNNWGGGPGGPGSSPGKVAGNSAVTPMNMAAQPMQPAQPTPPPLRGGDPNTAATQWAINNHYLDRAPTGGLTQQQQQNLAIDSAATQFGINHGMLGQGWTGHLTPQQMTNLEARGFDPSKANFASQFGGQPQVPPDILLPRTPQVPPDILPPRPQPTPPIPPSMQSPGKIAGNSAAMNFGTMPGGILPPNYESFGTAPSAAASSQLNNGNFQWGGSSTPGKVAGNSSVTPMNMPVQPYTGYGARRGGRIGLATGGIQPAQPQSGPLADPNNPFVGPTPGFGDISARMSNAVGQIPAAQMPISGQGVPPPPPGTPSGLARSFVPSPGRGIPIPQLRGPAGMAAPTDAKGNVITTPISNYTPPPETSAPFVTIPNRTPVAGPSAPSSGPPAPTPTQQLQQQFPNIDPNTVAVVLQQNNGNVQLARQTLGQFGGMGAWNAGPTGSSSGIGGAGAGPAGVGAVGATAASSSNGPSATGGVPGGGVAGQGGNTSAGEGTTGGPAGTTGGDGTGDGEAHGGRIRYDSGGNVMLAGALGSGQPAGGGNPLQGNVLQQFMQLPPEKLQELSQRIPPTTPQGALVQRAMQMKRMQPGADTRPPPGFPGQPPQAGMAPQAAQAPQAAPTPSPMMYRGGRAGFQDAGVVPGFVNDSGDEYQIGSPIAPPAASPAAPIPQAGQFPANMSPNPGQPGWKGYGAQPQGPDLPRPLSPEWFKQHSIFAPPAGELERENRSQRPQPKVGDTLPLPGGGSIDVAPDAMKSAEPKSSEAIPPPPRAKPDVPQPAVPQYPHGIGPPAPPPPAGQAGPSLKGSDPSALNPKGGVGVSQSPTPQFQSPAEQSQLQKLSMSPWAALTNAGFAAMASRSPHPLVAIGEGGMQGMKTLESQGAAEREYAGKQRQYELEAKKLDEALNYHKENMARLTAAEKDRQEYRVMEHERRQQEADARQQGYKANYANAVRGYMGQLQGDPYWGGRSDAEKFARAAWMAGFEPGQPIPVPNAAHIQGLREHPEQAAGFDRKFGPGSADMILSKAAATP